MTEDVKFAAFPAIHSGMEEALCYQVRNHQSTNGVSVGIENSVMILILNAEGNGNGLKR